MFWVEVWRGKKFRAPRKKKDREIQSADIFRHKYHDMKLECFLCVC
jgi:hypothetical protein